MAHSIENTPDNCHCRHRRREALNSRGNSAVELDVIVEVGFLCWAALPCNAPTGFQNAVNEFTS
jgi:enolase